MCLPHAFVLCILYFKSAFASVGYSVYLFVSVLVLNLVDLYGMDVLS